MAFDYKKEYKQTIGKLTTVIRHPVRKRQSF